jgi:uncharacterized integral membrane protein (TIGR00698 family)
MQSGPLAPARLGAVVRGSGRDAPGTGRRPGLALAVAVAAVATVAAHWIPIVGGPVLGIVLGVSLATAHRPSRALEPGIAFAGRSVLQVAVVVLGAQLSLGEVVSIGLRSLPVLLGTLAVCLLLAAALGRLLRVPSDLRTLIGVGTGICGASAIAAVTPVIDAAAIDVAYAISTIFLFNIAAVILFPILGHALGLGQQAFGVFAGTAVNDMSSVVAAATTYGSGAAHTAVVVKLTRTLMIIPICVVLAIGERRHDRASRAHRFSARSVLKLVPAFLFGFLALAAANSAGLIPASTHHALTEVATLLITVALSAIGLSTDLAGFKRTGARPILLGAALWVAVSATSLGLQSLTGL